MDKLKVLFGDGALTFDKFLEALGAQKICSTSFCQKTTTSLRDCRFLFYLHYNKPSESPLP